MLELSSEDDAERNGERFERLWEEERERCREKEGESPSLTRVVWRFTRVRFILSLLLIAFSMVAQLVGWNCGQRAAASSLTVLTSG